jgi:hypothetical protein
MLFSKGFLNRGLFTFYIKIFQAVQKYSFEILYLTNEDTLFDGN